MDASLEICSAPSRLQFTDFNYDSSAHNWGKKKSLAHLYHILLGLLDGVLNVEIRLRVGDGVTDTNGVTYKSRKPTKDPSTQKLGTTGDAGGTMNVTEFAWSRKRSLTLDEQPVVDDSLNVGVEEAGDVMTHF